MIEPAKVKSPCIGVCEFHITHDVCKGCYRTMSEKARWGIMPYLEQIATVNLIRIRRSKYGNLMPPKVPVQEKLALEHQQE